MLVEKSRHQLTVRKKFKLLPSVSCSDGEEGLQPVPKKTECLEVLSILAEFYNGSWNEEWGEPKPSSTGPQVSAFCCGANLGILFRSVRDAHRDNKRGF